MAKVLLIVEKRQRNGKNVVKERFRGYHIWSDSGYENTVVSIQSHSVFSSMS